MMNPMMPSPLSGQQLITHGVGGRAGGMVPPELVAPQGPPMPPGTPGVPPGLSQAMQDPRIAAYVKALMGR